MITCTVHHEWAVDFSFSSFQWDRNPDGPSPFLNQSQVFWIYFINQTSHGAGRYRCDARFITTTPGTNTTEWHHNDILRSRDQMRWCEEVNTSQNAYVIHYLCLSKIIGTCGHWRRFNCHAYVMFILFKLSHFLEGNDAILDVVIWACVAKQE